ncbi:MAG: DUF1385 domain-containing protein [Angelakisella sp.]
MSNSSCKKKTSIGGQALIEGIMMRGPIKSAMAVRTPDGSIDLEEWATYPNGKPPKYKKMPFVRGIFNMFDTLSLGFGCLMKSADKAGLEEEEPSKFEKWLSAKLGKGLNTIVSAVAVVLGICLAMLMFIVIPTTITTLLKPFFTGTMAFSIIEGIIKMCIFLLYLFLCSKSKDVARVFEYHGAEHKTIACYEAGEELTPENCRKYIRFHPRCGTSFLLIVIVVSILISSFIPPMTALLRMLVKLALLPLVIGVAYEFIKLAGKYDNLFTRFFSAPGLALQRLTTKEPDDSELECAIAAMKAVIPEDGQDEW